jgi:hypothetical protein
MEKAAFKPQDTEIQQLMQIVSLPGYQVLQRVMMAEVDGFQIDMMNVDPTKPNYDVEVRAKHSIALAAGMFYQRLQERVAGYANRLKEKDGPPILPDPTEEVFG